MFIIRNKGIFIGISTALVLASIILLSVFGLKLGIEFKGGAATEIAYTGTRPDTALVQEAIKTAGIGEVVLQPTGDAGFLIKSRDLSEADHQALLKAVALDGKQKVEEKNYTSIGPSIGQELKQKAIWAILLVMGAIILFIAYAFRKVSRPVSSWRYGLIAVVTLFHDIAITVGAFILISRAQGVELDTLFVVALLTVLGLSVSDTIVVFDRIRENIRHHLSPQFSETVGKSLSQTFTRSINTSLTVILVLLSLYFFGPASTKVFSLVLAIGLFFGTYSSIFLASPLLVLTEDWQQRQLAKKKANKKK